MNKILNINLGGIPFVIDLDAYEHLSNYLETIESHFSHSEGFEEITSDIEARLGELFQERLGKREIIIVSDVQETIAVMGTPEEFGAEASFDAEEARSHSAKSGKSYHTGRKLFRDPDDKQVAGVAAGLAAYFGVEDPIWVRLGFVAAFMFGGFGLPLYIILWIITPEALTSADRLAMRGEKVDVNNMARIIEEEIHDIADKITDFGSDIVDRKKKVKMKRKNTVDSDFDPPLRKGFLW
ncbi:MAG: PspC domain-containing protein [Bacteroidia bacterium]|nr:PspC domain-containing protein [Bacteroidia bacterium]